MNRWYYLICEDWGKEYPPIAFRAIGELEALKKSIIDIKAHGKSWKIYEKNEILQEMVEIKNEI